MNIGLFRYAFALILLSLIAGFFIPLMAVPRLGLSAHTIGALSGVLLIAVGAIWPCFRLSPRQAALLEWSWVYSSYANWFACLAGAVLGAGNMTPIASAGLVGAAASEAFVSGLFVTVAISSPVACGLSLWGLRAQS
jgi:hydroxylaminobenzene mutase